MTNKFSVSVIESFVLLQIFLSLLGFLPSVLLDKLSRDNSGDSRHHHHGKNRSDKIGFIYKEKAGRINKPNTVGPLDN
ncbi:hypothetical protein YC2023_097636 [Brassica napus]